MAPLNYRIFLAFFGTWLLLVSCEQEDPNALFTELSPNKTGVKFKNLVGESEEFNVLTYGYFYQGGGVAVGDVNNDGLPDLFFTANMMASKLYLNKGNFEFEDITEAAGVAAAGLWNTGATMADVNGDGLLDIYICRSAANDPNNRRNLLFINQGDLTFKEQGKAFGLDDPGYSTQASFFDYDNDGDLDMFLINHSTQEYAGFSRIDGSFKNRTEPFLGDKLYRNDGGKFTDVTKESGILSNVLGFGLAVTVTDVNNDGWLDIYVSNDYNEEDYLYINQQDGRFKESVRDFTGHVSLFSMGSDGADLNNDFYPDLVTMDMMPEFNFNQKSILGPENYDKYRELINKGFHNQTMRNMLHLNQGNGTFSEIGQYAGISHTDWSWAVLAADFDNDGWKDIFITNGYARNYLDMDFLNYMVSERIKANQSSQVEALTGLIDKMPPIFVANYLYHNNGDLTFTNRAKEWGLGALTVSNAASYADLDGDGDLDLIVCHHNDMVSIYRNNTERLFDRQFLKVKLKGKGMNTSGIGAKVQVFSAGNQMQQELIPSRGYQSAVDHELVFGLGTATSIDSLRVFWPGGGTQVLENIPVNESILLDQENAVVPQFIKEDPKTLLVEVEDALGIDFIHRESGFLDFTQDRLMPNTMGTLGPKIAIADVNGDGLEDLYIGGGLEQAGQLFLQDRQGGFMAAAQVLFEKDKNFIDTDAVLADFNGDGFPDLYVVSGGSDFPAGDDAYQDRLYVNDGKGNFIRQTNALPVMKVSGSTVKVADINGDGSLDLFVGGRYSPGNYPQAPRSYLLLNDGNGTFKDVTAAYAHELQSPGLVTGAAFLDINDDERPDLVLVGEWMGVEVFLNEGGARYIKSHEELTSKTLGWWLSLKEGDLNGDGNPKLILGNYGQNLLYNASEEQPLRMIYKDFDGNEQVDPLLTYYIADTNAFAFSRDELIGQMARMKGTFPDYRSFAKAGAADLFSSLNMEGADSLKAVMLQSIQLKIDGAGTFSIKPLPPEAQFSPLYAVAVVDVNGDGILDMLTGGNLTKTRVSTGKLDANPGYVFSGDQKGGYGLVPPGKAGPTIREDVRDIKKIEIQGKEYFIYAINNGEVRVFKKQIE